MRPAAAAPLDPPQWRRLYRLRWLAFLLMVLAYELSFFHRVAPAAIAEELQREFSASGAALGSLAASYFYIYTVMQIPTGVLVDTFGPRRVVTFGGIVAGLGSIIFGQADSLAVASLGRVLVGFGVSFMFLAMLKINALWFHERHFGAVTGLAMFLGNVGSTLAAAPLVWVLGFTTWRSVFLVLGIFSMVLATLTWWLVRDSPRDAGLPSMRELDGFAPHPPRTGNWWDGLKEVARNPATWPGILPTFGVAGSMLAFAGLWAVPYLRDVYAMPKSQAVLHTTWLLIGFALGAVVVGALSDRLRRRRSVMIGAVSLYLVAWLPLVLQWQLTAPWSYVLFFLIGSCAAGFTLSWAIAKEVNRPALSGMATGIVNTGVFLGVAVLQPLVGWAMDLGWDGRMLNGVRIYSVATHQVGIFILFGAAVLGLVGALLVRETRARHFPG